MSWRRRYDTLKRAGLVQVASAKVWIALGGDGRVRKGLKIRPGGLVVDVGAYQGEFTSFVRQDFHARVTAVEPIPEYAASLDERFSFDADVEILPCALGREGGRVVLQMSDDGSSAWIEGGRSVEVPLMDVAEVVNDNHIDVLKLNAEGAEFDVLERLLETRQIEQIDSILVQFHSFVPMARKRRQSIRKRLRTTHRCTWNVPWVWEMWNRRQALD